MTSNIVAGTIRIVNVKQREVTQITIKKTFDELSKTKVFNDGIIEMAQRRMTFTLKFNCCKISNVQFEQFPLLLVARCRVVSDSDRARAST